MTDKAAMSDVGGICDEIESCIPDDIELWRMLRAAGRKDADKAKAIDRALEPVRRGVAMIRHNQEASALMKEKAL